MNEKQFWGSIDISNWASTPSISNRVATEDDVANGFAVFYIRTYNYEHLPLNIPIPSIAYQLDKETNQKTIVIIIQAERVDGDGVIGVRYLDGGNGICDLNEIEFDNIKFT